MSFMPIARPKVFLGTPAYSGVSCRYLESLIETRDAMTSAGIELILNCIPGCPLVHEARDTIVANFEDSGADVLWMVDNDIGWATQTAMAMLQRVATDPDAPFVVAAPPMRLYQLEAMANALRRNPQIAAPERFANRFAVQLLEGESRLAVDRFGFAPISHSTLQFSMMRREVFAAIRKSDPTIACTTRGGKKGHSYFLPAIMDGHLNGEDMSFCKRWQKTDGGMLLFLDAPFIHAGPHEFYGNIGDLVLERAQEQPPIANPKA